MAGRLRGDKHSHRFAAALAGVGGGRRRRQAGDGDVNVLIARRRLQRVGERNPNRVIRPQSTVGEAPSAIGEAPRAIAAARRRRNAAARARDRMRRKKQNRRRAGEASVDHFDVGIARARRRMRRSKNPRLVRIDVDRRGANRDSPPSIDLRECLFAERGIDSRAQFARVRRRPPPVPPRPPQRPRAAAARHRARKNAPPALLEKAHDVVRRDSRRERASD